MGSMGRTMIVLAVSLAACGAQEDLSNLATDAGTTPTMMMPDTSFAPSADGGMPAADADPNANPNADGGASTPTLVTIGGARPAALRIPATYDASKSYPMVILLHGYSASGQLQDIYFGLSTLVDSREILLALPDGTVEEGGAGNRFWNATAGCCNFFGSTVDDVGYLVSLIDEASARFNVDPRRVYLIGHSNGGFMAYRTACDAPERIAAIVSLAGVTHQDEADCPATTPVSVLQVHGTADTTILYAGSSSGLRIYPSAEATVERWATRAGCDLAAREETAAAKDLDVNVPGAETDVRRYRAGCQAGIGVELWRINNGRHVPVLQSSFREEVLDFMLAHPKP